MQEPMLYILYHTMVEQRKSDLARRPRYQYAMQVWGEKWNGSEVDREDGAWTREDAWGEIAFSIGVDLGMRLARELEEFGWDDEL